LWAADLELDPLGVVTAGIAPVPTGGVQGRYPIALNQGGPRFHRTWDLISKGLA